MNIKPAKQKTLFMLGAFCIIAGIVIAKISNEANHPMLTVIGVAMIAIGAILISINIIMRLIEHSRNTQKK